MWHWNIFYVPLNTKLFHIIFNKKKTSQIWQAFPFIFLLFLITYLHFLRTFLSKFFQQTIQNFEKNENVEKKNENLGKNENLKKTNWKFLTRNLKLKFWKKTSTIAIRIFNFFLKLFSQKILGLIWKLLDANIL